MPQELHPFVGPVVMRSYGLADVFGLMALMLGALGVYAGASAPCRLV